MDRAIELVKHPLLAYYIKPNIAKKLLEHLTTISCEGNVDAYINDYMKHYGTNNKYISHVNHMMDSTLGTTIEHPDIKE